MSMKLSGDRMKRVIGISRSGRPIHQIIGASSVEPPPVVEVVDPVIDPPEPEEEEKEKEKPRVYSQDEYDTIIRRLNAADKAKGEFEKQVRTAEMKDKTDLERAKAEAEEAKKAAEAAAEDLRKMRVNNKFLASNKHTWHDPESALALIDLSEVEISDAGEVIGLEKAIENLAKAKPFLIKDSKPGGKEATSAQKSGGQPSGETAPDRVKDRAAMVKKYPALRGRTDV